jgi:hypothetical protein
VSFYVKAYQYFFLVLDRMRWRVQYKVENGVLTPSFYNLETGTATLERPEGFHKDWERDDMKLIKLSASNRRSQAPLISPATPIKPAENVPQKSPGSISEPGSSQKQKGPKKRIGWSDQEEYNLLEGAKR